MYQITEQALNAIKESSKLKLLIAANMDVSPLTVQKWLRERSAPLAHYTVLALVAKHLQLSVQDCVEKTRKSYEFTENRY
jgi:hypothetical protein